MTGRKDKSDAGQAEAQKAADEAEAKGYIGESPDPHDNVEYSIQSGPDSPGAVPDDKTPVSQPTPEEG